MNLFTLGTITLLKPEIINTTTFSVEVSTNDLTFNFPHFEGQISINIMPTHIKVQELDIARWILPEDHHVRLLNLGTTKNL